MTKSKIAVVLGSVALVLGSVASAFAQTIYASSTAETAVASGFSDIGGMIVIAVIGVIGAWAALTGLGFAKRKATHYVTGKKF